MYDAFIYTLFVFWICGGLSVLVDIDHIWTIFKRVPPFRLSVSYGRPFHTRNVFIVVACIACIFVVTFADGFYKGILQQFGGGGGALFFLFITFLTCIIIKYVGNKLLLHTIEIRKSWRSKKERPKNVR